MVEDVARGDARPELALPRARLELEAPLRLAEHRVSLDRTDPAATGVDALRRETARAWTTACREPALVHAVFRATPVADPGGMERGRILTQLRVAVHEEGGYGSAHVQPALDRARASLNERTAAFVAHLAAGPDAAAVRNTLLTETDADARADAWAEHHVHRAGAASIARDILQLRTEVAHALGHANHQTRVDRLAAFARVREDWLTRMAEAARVRARRDDAALRRTWGGPVAPWDRRRAARINAMPTVDRDVAVAHLRAWLQSAGLTVDFDVAPRMGKRGGAWTRILPTQSAVIVCASLPEALDAQGRRTLLHEVGHAAEAAARLTDPAMLRPLAPPDALELASTGLEPFAWHPATVRALGGIVDDPAVLEVDHRRTLGRPALLQIGLARVDLALHRDFDPHRDGSPLPWAQRVLASVEGADRDPRDATVLALHLFGQPDGYAGRYATYALGDALAVATRSDATLSSALKTRAQTLWTVAATSDPATALRRSLGRSPGPEAFIRAAIGASSPV
ncbi:MAG: M3 family metallopeptidase [Myxococcota bacterium]